MRIGSCLTTKEPVYFQTELTLEGRRGKNFGLHLTDLTKSHALCLALAMDDPAAILSFPLLSARNREPMATGYNTAA